MLAYAAGRPRVGARQSSPNAMLLVICAHIILIALLLSAKMTSAPRASFPPTEIIPVRLPKSPPPLPAAHPQSPLNRFTEPNETPASPPSPMPIEIQVDSGIKEVAPIIGSGDLAIPDVQPFPSQPVASSSGPQLLTPASELKPPYPEAKLLTGEEATLVLRLSIDEHGRVIAVDPVGRADPVFLAAARAHLIAHWRYEPAMKDGRATSSTTIINLRFELNG